MTKENIGAKLVAKSPMMVSEADSSPSAALQHTQKQQQQLNQKQVEANKSVGGGRRKRRRSKRHVQHGGAGDGIIIPQAPATGGSSEDANAGIKQNFTAITQAGSDAQYDNPPKVGGRRRTRRKRRRKRRKSHKKRRKTKRKKHRKRKNTKKNRK